jgi:hypothetical protein
MSNPTRLNVNSHWMAGPVLSEKKLTHDDRVAVCIGDPIIITSEVFELLRRAFGAGEIHGWANCGFHFLNGGWTGRPNSVRIIRGCRQCRKQASDGENDYFIHGLARCSCCDQFVGKTPGASLGQVIRTSLPRKPRWKRSAVPPAGAHSRTRFARGALRGAQFR